MSPPNDIILKMSLSFEIQYRKKRSKTPHLQFKHNETRLVCVCATSKVPLRYESPSPPSFPMKEAKTWGARIGPAIPVVLMPLFCVKSVYVNSFLFHVVGTATRDNVGRQVESLWRFSVGYNPKFLCSGVNLFRPLKFWIITMFLTIFGEYEYH